MIHLTRAYAQMESSKREGLITSSLDLHFKQTNKANWLQSKREEYLVLYPIDRESTVEEKLIEYQEYLVSTVDEVVVTELEYEYSRVIIDYTYCEWIEPVAPTYTYNEDGSKAELTPAIDGYYSPDTCVKTFNQWLEDFTYVEHDTTLDIASFKSSDSKYLAYSKSNRDIAMQNIVITHNTVAYDANNKAIGNMSAVIGIANFKYNQLLAQDVLPSDAYSIIYKETKIFWKGADNKPHEIMIESVCEALEMSMLEVAKIIGV